MPAAKACEGSSTTESHKQARPWGSPCCPQPCLPGPQAGRGAAANARRALSLLMAGRNLEDHHCQLGLVHETAVPTLQWAQPSHASRQAAEAAARATHHPWLMRSCLLQALWNQYSNSACVLVTHGVLPGTKLQQAKSLKQDKVSASVTHRGGRAVPKTPPVSAGSI